MEGWIDGRAYEWKTEERTDRIKKRKGVQTNGQRYVRTDARKNSEGLDFGERVFINFFHTF